MGTLIVRRPARSTRPDTGTGPIDLVAPPRQGESAPMSGSLGMILVPAASGVGAVLLAVTQQDRPLMAAAGLLVLAASIAVGLAMVIGSRTGTRRRTRENRERYLDYLEQVRIAARDGMDRQRTYAALTHPDPMTSAGLARKSTRRWERRPADVDFLVLRVGTGVVPLDTPLRLQADANDPLVAYDPVCLAAAQELAETYMELPDQPISLALDGASVSVIGSAERVRGIARALLAQLAWSHSPAEVAVVVCSAGRDDVWEWLKWLPHSLSDHERDGPLPARLVASTPAQALEIMTAEYAEGAANLTGASRRTVLVIDHTPGRWQPASDLSTLYAAARAVGAAQLHLLLDRSDEPGNVDTRVLADAFVVEQDPRRGPTSSVRSGDPTDDDAPDLVEFGPARSVRCRLDVLDPADALLTARSFAPLRAGEDSITSRRSDQRVADVRFGDVAVIDPAVTWRRRTPADLLRVPIGAAVDGGPVFLDVKESAQGGMGPHGLVVGATGSGKSELLRTLVTALTISHPPETLALLLADFKGGATFSGLARLPHVAGMITNLEADLSLVDRFRDALAGEVQRRQELLATAGKLTSLEQYRELRHRRPELEVMPHLLVIVDEFSELLGARPDLTDLFVTIGRIGRSMGIHLLLATQRLDTGRIRGLESHLSYRVCLRTFSEAESREAIGSPEAYHLPAEPGWGYLRADSPELRLFRGVTVSRPYRPPRSDPVSAGTAILPFTVHNGIAARIAALHDSHLLTGSDSITGARHVPAGSSTGSGGRSVLDIAVDRLTTLAPLVSQGRPARRVWLDPLPHRLTLTELLRHSETEAAAATGRGNRDLRPQVAPVGRQGRVTAVLGLVDVPERQHQEALGWDFTDGNGNLLIVGAGRTGKSTALRTLMVSLALHYPPGAVQMICIDFGGATLVPLQGLPHVAAVATRSNPELLNRVAARIASLLAEREALFRRGRFESTAGLRRARAAGEVGSDVAGDIVLIFDGWAEVSESDGMTDGLLDEILRRGPRVGVHTVLTAGSPSQLRTRLIAGFGGRIELKLSDSFDSAIDRQSARTLPAGIPGRALVAGRHFAQLALPWLGADPGHVGNVSTGGPQRPGHSAHSAEHVIEAVRARWPGQSAPRIRTLPARISLPDLRAMTDMGCSPSTVLLGLGDGELRPVRHDFAGESAHLIVYGDSRSGKTSMLRGLLTQLLQPVSATGESSVRVARDVVLIDYRRGLHPVSTEGSIGLTVATSPAQAATVCGSVATELALRLSDPFDAVNRGFGPPTDEPADGNSRDGARSEIYLLVDDYDLVGTVAGNPLNQLVPYLAHSRDVAFHLVLTRRAGGAARAQYEALLQSLGELGTPVMMLSGSPTEGRLAQGIVPRQLPAGRAQFVTRGNDLQLIQIPWVD